MKEYKLQFLNDKEFEALSLTNPRYLNTKDDFGFADMQTNRIFVRKTNVPIIDQFVTQHEIEEVLSKYSAHEDEFAIRHKKGKDFVRILAPIAGGLLGGPLLGGLASSLLGVGSTMAGAIGGGLGSTLGSVASQAGTGQKINPLSTVLSAAGGALGGAGMAPGIQASKAAGGGLVGQTLSGAQSMLGIQSGAQKLMSAPLQGPVTQSQSLMGYNNLSQVPSNIIGSAAANTAAATLGKLQGPVTASQAAQGYTNLSQVPTITGNLPAAQTLGMQSPVTGNQAGAPQSGVTQGSQGLSNIQTQSVQSGIPGIGDEVAKTSTKTPMLEKLLGQNWRQTILGTAVPLLGQTTTSMFGGTTAEPFSPEQSALFNETVNMVRSGAQVQMTAAQQKSITDQYDSALESARQNIMDRYKALRPGSDIENDSQLKEALLELETDVAEKKANALASAQLGLSAQQTQMMSELAAMDIYALSQKAGISYAEARDFKNMLGQMGYIVSTAGQPIMQMR